MSEVSGTKTSGYLMKRGEKGLVKGYKKRWFVFNTEDAEKRCFYYPSRDDMVKELGFISMSTVTDIRKPASSSFDFEIQVPGRVYYLQAPTEKEMNVWIETLTPHIGGGSGGSGGGSNDDAIKQRDEKIAQLEQKLKALQAEGGETDEQKMRIELHAANEKAEKLAAELEKAKKSVEELEGKLHSKDDELQALKVKSKKSEDSHAEELTELKKEYFRACAIGIVQQRKITKDLPPVAELYKSCLDDGTEWKDFVPWIKTTLPKK
eukprot:CAMPEP_0119120714 /NCGR_PEP_ID=MMETSP1310-20130426/1640_1 /TAXON_ID=464262 /ORGANISM="Genus nov. species nov., Strain RCC2339" /LENGTH=263 /DNA_ID=CAMNT_0007110215 /DNA_START=155 /DNA_END=946 /DNA_ORIENTATION=+